MRKRLGELASCGETEKGGHGLWRLKGDVADPYGGVAELKTAAASAPSRNLVRSVFVDDFLPVRPRLRTFVFF
jgi:hypothetical protein